MNRSLAYRIVIVFTVAAIFLIGSSVAQNPTSFTFPGDLQQQIGCGGDWEPTCAITHLTYDANDDVWQGTFSVPAGNWQYKAALNDSWDENYGLNATPGGANIS